MMDERIQAGDFAATIPPGYVDHVQLWANELKS